MIWLRRIAWRWTNALILDVQALGWSQRLVRGVAPELTTDKHMEVLCESFGKTVSQSLDHDNVVVITIGLELTADLVLLETCRSCETTDVILNTRFFWCNKVRHGDKAGLLHVELLAEHHELAFLLSWVLGVHNLHIIEIDSVARVKADNSSCLDHVFINKSSQHDLSIVEKFLGLFTNSLV